MKRKLVSLMLVVSMTAAMVAGCGSDDKKTADNNAAGTEKTDDSKEAASGSVYYLNFKPEQAGNLGLWKAVPKFDAAHGMKFLTYAVPAIRNAMMDMVRDAFAAFEQRMQTEDKDGVCYQRVSLDDVLPGEEQLRRIEAVADPYAMQPQSIMEEQESRRELYNGLQRLTDREQTYLLYRYGFTDGEEHPLIGTAIYFHLTKSRAKKTEEQAMDNLWLELPWWFD